MTAKKSATLHALRGNPSKISKAKLEAECSAAAAADAIPELDETSPHLAHLSPSARAISGELIRTLPRLRAPDLGLVMAHAAALDRWLVSQSRVEPGSLLIRSASKAEGYGYRVNPYIKLAKGFLEEVLRTGALIGCDPISRAKILASVGAKAKAARVVTDDGDEGEGMAPAEGGSDDPWLRVLKARKR